MQNADKLSLSGELNPPPNNLYNCISRNDRPVSYIIEIGNNIKRLFIDTPPMILPSRKREGVSSRASDVTVNPTAADQHIVVTTSV